MRVAIGVSLGPAVASSISLNSSDLPFAISSAFLVTLLTALGGMYWFRAQTNLSGSSAFLSALPGGLSVFLGLSSNISDRPQILLIHTIRVVIVVVFISLMARVIGIPVQDAPLMASLNWQGGSNPLLLLVLLIANFAIAEKLDIAGGHVIIPMLTTAALVASTPIALVIPAIVQSVAMLIFGVVIGQQIADLPIGENKRLVSAGVVFSALAILLVALIAWGLSGMLTHGFLVLFLALAPGGIAEVSLVALALGLDAGLVAMIHSCRFLFIVVVGPFAYRWFDGDG